jgi:hypothetical protein
MWRPRRRVSAVTDAVPSMARTQPGRTGPTVTVLWMINRPADVGEGECAVGHVLDLVERG